MKMLVDVKASQMQIYTTISCSNTHCLVRLWHIYDGVCKPEPYEAVSSVRRCVDSLGVRATGTVTKGINGQ